VIRSGRGRGVQVGKASGTVLGPSNATGSIDTGFRLSR
jgi:hypothetical protein